MFKKLNFYLRVRYWRGQSLGLAPWPTERDCNNGEYLLIWVNLTDSERKSCLSRTAPKGVRSSLPLVTGTKQSVQNFRQAIFVPCLDLIVDNSIS